MKYEIWAKYASGYNIKMESYWSREYAYRRLTEMRGFKTSATFYMVYPIWHGLFSKV